MNSKILVLMLAILANSVSQIIKVSKPRKCQMPQIKGLKFTTKGGEGSGHHGHTGGEGGKGKPGGSVAGTGNTVCVALMEKATGYGYFGYMKDIQKKAMIDLGRKIPDEHVEGLKKIKFGPDEIIRENNAQAYYDSDKQMIRSIAGPQQVMAHEIGHHVARHIVGLGKIDKISKGDRRRLRKTTDDTAKLAGIRRKEIIGDSYPDEFFAESYSLWARTSGSAGAGDWVYDGTRWLTGKEVRSNYRSAFPDTAEFLDELFGGR